MTPYYEEPGITIYHGDCREILPQLEPVDLVLTDPPYGIGKDGQKRSDGAHGGRKAYEFLGWDGQRPTDSTFALLMAAADQHIIWGGNYFTDYLPAQAKWFVWDKGQRINQSDGELAWTSLGGGALRICTFNRVELRMDGAEHPTQKPLRLIKWCLNQVPYAQTILDPFMGSGTTLVAARDLGRKCIGIEVERRYCDIAIERLRQRVLPINDPLPGGHADTQEGLFP